MAFVAGAVVSPLMHQATHRADHVHGVGAQQQQAGPSRASHRGAWVDHGAQDGAPQHHEDQDGPAEDPLHHGDGSAAHFLAALEHGWTWSLELRRPVPVGSQQAVCVVEIRPLDPVWPPLLAQGPPRRS